jgi:hypothetical protein
VWQLQDKLRALAGYCSPLALEGNIRLTETESLFPENINDFCNKICH